MSQESVLGPIVLLLKWLFHQTKRVLCVLVFDGTCISAMAFSFLFFIVSSSISVCARRVFATEPVFSLGIKIFWFFFGRGGGGLLFCFCSFLLFDCFLFNKKMLSVFSVSAWFVRNEIVFFLFWIYICKFCNKNNVSMFFSDNYS